MLPKLIITDIDGVWTDGGMYYDSNGGEIKKFNTSDSAGVLFCKLLDIPVGIITGEDTSMVLRRAEKLKIPLLRMGVANKLKEVEEILEDMNIRWSDVAYIGDDINDIELLRKVGLSGTPANAPEYIQSMVDVVIPVKGGDGAFRAFVEWILNKEDQLEVVLNMYLDKLKG